MLTFVLDSQDRPTTPIHNQEASQLVENGKAHVHRTKPFVIQLNESKKKKAIPLKVKLYPGIKSTGIAVLKPNDAQSYEVQFMIEIRHRKGIADDLIQKQSHKRDRDRLKRNRKRDPNRSYKERRDVIRTLFNANLNE